MLPLALIAACLALPLRAATLGPATDDSGSPIAAVLPADDECIAGGDERCALSAVQLRARRALQGGAAPSGLPDQAQPGELPDEHSASQNAPQGPSAGSLTPPVVVKGNFLYNSATGDRFFAKGVAYNPRNVDYSQVQGKKSKACAAGTPKFQELGYADDPVTDDLEEQWRPAVKAIADLGANVVRIYNVDPEMPHGKFMTAAAELGLYVIVPLTRKDWGYLPAFPAPACYEENIPDYGNVGVNVLTSAKLIVKQFSQYNNTLLFTVANEMTVNDKNGYAAFPCVKALTRDIHHYQSSCAGGMRRIPLIYSDIDMGRPERVIVGEYLTCSLESDDDAVDVYGLNVYSWCDPAYPDENGKDQFNYSPYYDIYKDFAAFESPMLMTEFGCNTGAFETQCPYKDGRTWVQVKAIVEKMGEVFSGAVAFEFSMEKNQFGLALTPGFLKGQGKLELLDNYYALQKQFKKYNISSAWDGAEIDNCKWTPSDVAALSETRRRPKCPAQAVAAKVMKRRRVDKVSNWQVLPPTPEAPLANVGNQSECPAYTVSKLLQREACCHTKCV